MLAGNELEAVPDDAVLWRYQDIPRYLDLLLKRQLFFSCADKFEDPFEGRFTALTKQQMLKEKAQEEVEKISEAHVQQRTSVTVSSWHESNTENYAMWNIYAKGTYGLAIRTTLKRLRQSLQASGKKIIVGKVSYFNETLESIPYTDPLLLFFRKRDIYSYENEVRCCYVIDHNDEKDFLWQEQDRFTGVFVDVDINTLIDKIYISPYSPEWIKNIIEGINKKFNLDKEIVHSSVFESESY